MSAAKAPLRGGERVVLLSHAARPSDSVAAPLVEPVQNGLKDFGGLCLGLPFRQP